MQKSIFLEFEFWALVAFSFVFPLAILIGLLAKRTIARSAVLLFGVLLVIMSGVDFVLLRRLAAMATNSPSIFRDPGFGSELSIALYLLPVVFAGIGTNLISHVLIQHLSAAEKNFDNEHPRR